ncbi:MAG: nucleotide sugar dehydrogenase [Parcubacteria group bacterium]|nr:nucleotide sugar dehydrogenase [Parcubacteria group bacterium]
MNSFRTKKSAPNNSVCVLGLGYVGLTLAVTLYECGKRVYGVDINRTVVDGINNLQPHFYEKGLRPLLEKQQREGFECFDTIPRDDLITTYIIAVGTPVLNYTPVFRDLENSARHIGAVLKRGDLVILRSTVPVGTTRDFVIPILEKCSGLTAGPDFSVAFAPERTVEGDALQELRTLPQVIAGIDKRSATLTQALFEHFAPQSIMLDFLEEAEMVKLLNNTFRDFNFAFANEFARACDVFNLDTNKIVHAANEAYTRDKIPVPSPGVGGYCLSKDPYILQYSARQRGYEMKLPAVGRSVNEAMPEYVYGQIMKFLNTHHKETAVKHVAILGFAFKGKPPTSDMRFSPTLDVLKFLKGNPNIHIHGHDFVVADDVIAKHGAKPIADGKAIFKDKHAIVIMTNHPEYKNLEIEHVREMAKPALIFDTWSMLPKEEIVNIKGLHYSNLGYDTI